MKQCMAHFTRFGTARPIEFLWCRSMRRSDTLSREAARKRSSSTAAPARPRMASTSSLDLGKIVPPAGFLHCRAAVLSAPVLWGRSASGRCGLTVSVSSSNGRSAFTCPPSCIFLWNCSRSWSSVQQ